MKRRDFFRFAGSSALVAGGAGLARPLHARNFPTAAKERTNSDGPYPEASPPVAAEFTSLLIWLRDHGWVQILRQLAGFDLEAVIAGDQAPLFTELKFDTISPLEEFGGKRAIQPGDPAMSLLYHVLAASEAVFPELSAESYPSAEQIDALENYIFDRMNLTETADLKLAIFAYEYRQAYKTPHRAHADMVYARAGISRTGTRDCAYDKVKREFRAPGTAVLPAQNCATVPARFGLFLARELSHDSIDKIAANSRDKKWKFLLPVCKLVSGGNHLGGRSIQFQQSHRDEKLARLMEKVGDNGEGFDLTKAPFVRISMSEDGPEGRKTFASQTASLVTIRSMRGSARVFPDARPLARPAVQSPGGRAHFKVPKKKGKSNRRYTSLKLVDGALGETIDAVLSDLVFRGGRPTTGFRSPRNAPAFVHIRAKLEESGIVKFLGSSDADLKEIEAGGYEAALFEDGLCDGCVTARLSDGSNGEIGKGLKLGNDDILPAISFVAAPDFFPRFDPLDLEDYDNLFLEGGTESASGLRRPANPLVELPDQTGSSAFPILNRQPIAETLTAVVSCPATSGRSYKAKGYVRSSALNTLTDTVSNVFFPGWDITYSSAEEETGSKHTFLASFGLGSPFLEDMKLCAAANGMWAGASPDAARTFYGSLDKLPYFGRPASAVPLLDLELGNHPESPAARLLQIESQRGWDGEYGPYIVVEFTADGKLDVSVNCADIMHSDYVRNAMDSQMDLGRMQNLGNQEVIARMAMLDTCIKALPKGGRTATTDMWLVSAEQVNSWANGAEAFGVPEGLIPRKSNNRLQAAPGLAGSGYLYLFAHCPSPGDGELQTEGRSMGRKSFPAKRLFLCVGDRQHMRFARLDRAPSSTDMPQWSRAYALRYR